MAGFEVTLYGRIVVSFGAYVGGRSEARQGSCTVEAGDGKGEPSGEFMDHFWDR